MSGQLMQLIAYGAQDAYLTYGCDMQFRKPIYKRYTDFAIPMDEFFSQLIKLPDYKSL